MNASIFNDKLRIGMVALTFIAYLVVTVIASAILIAAWLPGGLDYAQAAKLAETAPPVVTGELLIGLVFGLASGWFVTHLTGGKGLKNALVLGLVVVAYAILGIFLHPYAPLWKHALHLIAPVPVELAGGYLRLRTSRTAAVPG